MPAPVGARRFVIRATHERGVGVPSSRSLATATREATSVYGELLTSNAAIWMTRSNPSAAWVTDSIPVPRTSVLAAQSLYLVGLHESRAQYVDGPNLTAGTGGAICSNSRVGPISPCPKDARRRGDDEEMIEVSQRGRRWVAAAAVFAIAGPGPIMTIQTPWLAKADVCGDVGGRHVDVGGPEVDRRFRGSTSRAVSTQVNAFWKPSWSTSHGMRSCCAIERGG